MTFALGVVLFAIGIGISIALHECGHMWIAQATGMKVRRYFIGFGPKLFSFRRGETEYGLKLLPFGGFCDIAGMTALDELEVGEHDRAMFRQATWKRLAVMFGGIVMNFVLGFALIVGLAIAWGLPDRNVPPATALGQMACVPDLGPDGKPLKCTGDGPAQRAGLREGDVVTAVAGVPVDTWEEFQEQTREQTGPFEYTLVRAGQTMDVTITPERVTRKVKDSDGNIEPREVAAVGVGPQFYPPIKYSVGEAIPAAVLFTGDLGVQTFHGLIDMPSKVGALWTAVTGGERADDTPISVYGASVIGGEVAERGLWEIFVLLLASLNLFLGAFNLVPLLPLDGGHIAVVLYERVRNTIRQLRGRSIGDPVDYTKLLPVTYVVIVVGGAFMILTLVADIINPIKLF